MLRRTSLLHRALFQRAVARSRRRRTRRLTSPCPAERFVETLEDRTLLSGTSIQVPLDTELDQFGFQPVAVQALDDPNTAEVENWVGFSIFDTGASVVTLSALEHELFFQPKVPIKVEGGAVAQGIGGTLTGDVSHPLTVTVDGLGATSLTFDEFGFPLFEIEFTSDSLTMPGVQVFVGTLDEPGGSPNLPTIAGTPMLNPTTVHPDGTAVVIEPQGELLDFSDIFDGLVLPVPAVRFRPSGSDLTAEDYTVIAAGVDSTTAVPTATEFVGSEVLFPFDDFYVGFTLRFTSGDLAGEEGVVSGYDGETRTLVLAEPLSAAPADGDEFAIVRATTGPFHVDLELLGIDNHADPGDQLTVAPNPVHNGIRLSHDGVVLEDQNFLFDTGAMLSTITTEQAIQFGLDLNSPQDTVAVGGAAGTVLDVPGFVIDEFAVPTSDGGEIVFTDVWVYVIDVAEEIDGIWGMNLFNPAAAFQYDPFESDGTASLQITFFEDRLNLSGGLDPEVQALLELFPFAGALGVGAPQFPRFSTAVEESTEADLQVTTTASPEPVAAGTELTYTITVTNNGPDDAANVVLTDAVPAGTTFVSFTAPSGWITNAPAVGATGTVTATASTLADGGSDVLTLVVHVNADALGTISNAPQVSSVTIDPDPQNNSTTEETTITTSADLVVTKSDSPDSVVAGTELTYTITVTNDGPSYAENLVLSDAVPAGTTFVSFTAPTGWDTDTPAVGETGTVTATASTLADGEIVTFTLVVLVNADAVGSISNTAQVSSSTTDPDPQNDSATEETTITTSADLEVTKSDSPDSVVAGTELTYTITLTNDGPSYAENLVLSDAVPAGTTFVSFTAPDGWVTNTPAVGSTGTVTATASTLADGGSDVFTLVVEVNADALGTISNAPQVSSVTIDPDPQNNSATEETTITTSADLEVTKSDSPDSVVAGTELTYTITLTNDGPSDAENLVLSDAVPAGTTFVSFTAATEWDIDAPAVGESGSVTATASTLADGESVTFTLVVLVNADALGPVSNTAAASSDTSDPDPENDSATAETTVSSSADLAVTKSDDPDPVTAGDNLTFTIIVTNHGPSDAADVTLSDLVPENTTFISFAAPQGWTVDAPDVGETGTVTATASSLASGESATFTLVVRVDSETPGGSTITNTATVSATTNDPQSDNDEQTTTTEIAATGPLTRPTTSPPVGTSDDDTPTITWSEIPGADAYQVLVYHVNLGQEIINEFVAAPATSFTPSDPLPRQGTFQVFVRAIRDGGEGEEEGAVDPQQLEFGPFSVPEHFSINRAAPLPSPPQLTGPIGEMSDRTPTIAWTPIPGASTYEVQIYDRGFGQFLSAASATGVSGEVFEVPVELTAGREYEAFVRVDSPGLGSFGGPRIFTVTAAGITGGVGLTGPVSPINDSTPTFSWNEFPDAVDYRLELYDVDRGRRILVEENVAGTDFTLSDPVDEIDPLSQVPGNYQVFVRANLSAGAVSQWSAPIDFRIEHHGPVPAAANVTAPVTPTPDRTPTFIWDDLFHAATFDVTIETEAGAVVATADDLTDRFFVPPTPLEPGRYRFFVEARNTFGEAGPTSAAYELEVYTAQIPANGERNDETSSAGEVEIPSITEPDAPQIVAADPTPDPREAALNETRPAFDDRSAVPHASGRFAPSLREALPLEVAQETAGLDSEANRDLLDAVLSDWPQTEWWTDQDDPASDPRLVFAGLTAGLAVTWGVQRRAARLNSQ